MQANDTLIASYNGVMLCRRPTYEPPPVKNSGKHSLSQRKEKTSSQNEKGSFLCGTFPTPWGNTTTKIKSQKDKVLSRLSRNDGALTRHKQWLKDMQEKRAKRLKEKEEADQMKKEKDREFMERQARRRRKIRQLEREECDEIEKQHNIDGFGQEEDGANNDDDANQENKMMIGEKRCRPAWSLTEADAINTNEYIKEEEEEDIMNFVDRLDIEQYFDDMELKVLMTQLKDRIHQLEKQKKHDDVLLKTVLQSEKSANHDEKYNNWNYGDASRLAGDNYNREPVNDYNDISSIAESIKSCADASITSIHSHKSMQMLVAKSRDKMQEMCSNKGLIPINEEHPTEISMNPPITITHTEDNGARLAETKSLNKLPFKNRNPAL